MPTAKHKSHASPFEPVAAHGWRPARKRVVKPVDSNPETPLPEEVVPVGEKPATGIASRGSSTSRKI